MFISKTIVEKLSAFTEHGISRILSAKDAELAVTVAAKDEQIKFLKEQLAGANQAADRERNRAEAAIDQLLSKVADVQAVRFADIQRDAAKREAASDRPAAKDKVAELQRIYEQVSSVGEDGAEAENPMERLVSIGGQKI